MPSKEAPNERPADLLFWFRDGTCSQYTARSAADTRISIGRTNSKRALGFVVTRGRKSVDFVLDKDQVTEAAYLRIFSPRLLKPRGRKKRQFSIAATLANRK